MNKKAEEQAPDPMAEKRAEYDHETKQYSEPKLGDEPKVARHQVDPVRDPKLFEELGNGPVPRRADPFAAQRDQKAAAAENKKEAKKAEDKK